MYFVGNGNILIQVLFINDNFTFISEVCDKKLNTYMFKYVQISSLFVLVLPSQLCFCFDNKLANHISTMM